MMKAVLYHDVFPVDILVHVDWTVCIVHVFIKRVYVSLSVPVQYWMVQLWTTFQTHHNKHGILYHV